LPGRPHLTVRRARHLLPALVLLAACGGPVEIEAPELSAADEAACADFVGDLPDTLSDLDPVETEPEGAPGAAYGDPPIVITCGVDEPAGFAEGAPCESVDGVDWFVPAELYGDEAVDVTLTSAWSRPRVEVRIPSDYWPVATAAATGVLSPLVRQHLEIVGHCSA
jgi:hypothetical protein